MSDHPAICVLIPWCEREEISRTLAANAHAFQSNNAEVLVINCGGDSRRLRTLILTSEVANVRQLDIQAPRFNKCLALNAGLLHSRAEFIFVLDADIILLNESLSELRDGLRKRALATIEWVYESVPGTQRRDLVGDFTVTMVNRGVLELVFRDGSRIHHQINRQNPFENARAGRGLLMARKADLLRIQGYNSGLQTWGFEDDDVLIRLQHAAGLKWVERGCALHLSHGNEKRVLDKARDQSGQFNFIKCCRNYNRGVFTGTFQEDAIKLKESFPERVIETTTEASDHSHQFDGESRPQAGLEDCGAEGGVTIEREDHRNIPSLGDLLLAAALRKIAPAGAQILLGGTGDNLALSNQGFSIARASPWGGDFPGSLPAAAYDVIVDDHLASYACCRQHWAAVMEKYAKLLDARGALLTLESGIVGRPVQRCWEPTWLDVAATAGRYGLSLRKSGYGVCLLKPKSGANPAG